MKTTHGPVVSGVAVLSSLILAVWASAGVQQPAMPAAIGRVVSIEGQVSAARAGGKTVALQLKSPVYLNDKIVTGEKAKIQIMFDDDSVISQGEKGEMVLDEYVYKPKEKEKVNCSVRLLRGLFRVVTGKITDLNPDRFKVKTNMATIGIRGCDFGFDVQPGLEDILVLYLPRGRTAFVQQTGGAGANVLNIGAHGVAILIREGKDPEQRKLDALDRRNLIRNSTPGGGGGGAGNQGAAGGDPNANAGSSIMDALATRDQTQGSKGLLDTFGNPQLGNEPTGTPSTSKPDKPPPVLVGGHPEMTDWEWALWEDGSSVFNPNRYAGATFLTASEFQTIAGNATVYDLTGSGVAAAVLYDAASGQRKIVDGSCSIEVHVGNGTSPTWGGDFILGGTAGADGLSFWVDPSRDGWIDATGILRINGVSSYSMEVNRHVFGPADITAQRLTGRLIKPGLGAGPISAAAGSFEFLHGTAARANGVFGADFGLAVGVH